MKKKPIRSTSSGGKMVILDGPENVGCTTLSNLLAESFQRAGHPTLKVGLGFSDYITNDVNEVLKTHTLRPHTVALFRSTEIYDQVEKKILPALKAGFVVVADRLHYSVIAQAKVRGVNYKWLKTLFSKISLPAISIYLKAEPEQLVQRSFSQQGTLGFWDSGQDCVVRNELYDGFIEYQKRQKKEFKDIVLDYNMLSVPASGQALETYNKIKKILVAKLGKNLVA